MSLVKSFTHLTGRPKEQEALPLLQRIASLVKPIMRNHDWVLPTLAEFFPENDNLLGLNVNGGEKILLRLRPAWAPDTFYDEEQLVLVLLHELTHNVHGPHDSSFYALLSKLEQEYDDLKRSGYSGEGFHSVGARLGVGVSHDLPPHLAKVKALEAAEKRRRMAAVMKSGGRLGGRPNSRNRSPRELAAEAAERRARDEKSCGSRHGVEAEIEAQRAAQDSVIHAIDVDELPVVSNDKLASSSDISLLDNLLESTAGNTTEPPRKKGIVAASRRKPGSPSPSIARLPPKPNPSAPHSPTNQWSCTACTLLNPPLALRCAACFSARPPDPNIGWTCQACGEQGMPHDFWTCGFCGQVKRES